MKPSSVAVAMAAGALLIVLVVLMFTTGDNAPPSTSSTTAPPIVSSTPAVTEFVDHRNDGIVTEAERGDVALGATMTLNTLNRVARLVCAAVGTEPTRLAVRAAMLDRYQRVAPNLSTVTAAALTDEAARVACADAYDALPAG